MTDCKPEGAGSICPIESRMVLLLYADYQITFFGSSGRVIPGTISKEFYLEALKVPADRWAEEPVKVLLRTFFLRVLYKTSKIWNLLFWYAIFKLSNLMLLKASNILLHNT